MSFGAVAAEFAADRSVGTGRMFGSSGLKVAGRIFAMEVKGRLVVKLPQARVEELVASGAGERFDPGHGRLMKEWVSVAPGRNWVSLAHEARDFVGGKGR